MSQNRDKINLMVSNSAVFIESVFFPAVFFFYACKSIFFVYISYPSIYKMFIKIKTQNFNIQDTIFISHTLSMVVLFAFNILVAWGLLVRKNLYHKPEGFLEIIVPVIGTFFYLFYNFIGYFPQEWNFILIPERLLLIFSVIGFLQLFLV